ncbi:hypothetical protein I302_105878 [Kwoniella bestiolae CBS 10118]|uniref:Uncharacterized protein n=1 Tax=Kwoniella bestiolae CBS 10118 TaxID=1296100 RepID=A0A1B9G2E2_9TREE|nr:hypothetical protein I302_05003 [Kwoniella bestiolae CBS 10118]OCF25190.1 hypothetical protein I302_05003 [Kwoniella bestiolae CBS 10118]
MTGSLSLSLRRPKSFKSKSRQRSNTLSPPPSSSSSEPFDLSVIVDEKSFDTLDSVQQVIDTKNKKEGTIKFQLNDLPTSEEKMSSKLIKGRKRFVAEEGRGKPDALDLSGSKKVDMDNQLLPSPLIRPVFPKSPYPFPTPSSTEATLLPPSTSRDKKHTHRRSRSFSELITSSTSISQPWRDRETWLAIHTPNQQPTIPPRKGSIPAALEDGGWRGRGGGTFFGADMNGPYPSFRARVKPLSPPTSPRRYFTSRQQDFVTEPEEISDAKQDTPGSSPMEKIIYQHKSHSAWNVRSERHTSSSSDEELPLTTTTRYHTPIADDDEDLLPPLLPRRSNSPGRQTPSTPRTPSRENKNKHTSTSPLRGDTTPKPWKNVDPSPPRSGSNREKETSPLITPRTPDTPTRALTKAFGGRRVHQPKRADTPVTPSSPSFDMFFENEQEEQDHTRRSPSKRFWKALKMASPGGRSGKKVVSRGGSMDQGEGQVSPSKKSGWF